MTKRIVYGTMRLHTKFGSVPELADFFLRLHAAGITWLHSSNEYESFDLLCNVLKYLKETRPSVKFRHVVKIAEPSFDDDGFCYSRLLDKVDYYRSRLGVGCIDQLQWMWRKNIKNDEERISDFLGVKSEIQSAFDELRNKGVVSDFLCFPYSVEFAAAANNSGIFSGLTVYRNLEETQYDSALKDCPFLNESIAIRPFGAGKGFAQGRSTQEMLDYVFSDDLINGVILTVSSEDHLNELLEYMK